jgi:predicted MFS family arabinose efflux permease
MLLFVPTGPYRKKGAAFHPKALVTIFRSRDFSASAVGYFGHMWELYAWFAFIPVMLQLHQQHARDEHNIPLWSFILIGTGSIGCIAGGIISRKIGSAKVAFYALLSSGICCCLSWLFIPTNDTVFVIFALFWGLVITADSPQFSTLAAQTAPPENKGTALTFVVCIGFAITIAGIQCLSYFLHRYPTVYSFLILAPGPIIGVSVFYRLMKKMA